MKTLSLTILAAFIFFYCSVSAQTPSPKAVDRTDAAATAQALLRAYAAKDLPAMAELSTADNREIIKELIQQGESHGRWRSIFSGGRWQAVSTWNGKLGEIRYFERNASSGRFVDARVQFGETEPDELVVVNLSWEGGKWCFEDVNFPRRESFEQGSTTRPKMP
jgi:hypothetical protein